MKKIVLLILFLLGTSTLFAQNKIALIIGNGNYENITTLRNPVNDAKDMSSKLSNLGFDVISVIDGNLKEMESAIRKFKNKLQNSEAGIFYYAGHGIQIDGINYLIPKDAELIDEFEVKYTALSTNYVLDAMNATNCDLNIIILDACRNNPFSWGRSTSRGLAVTANAPSGAIIMYATDPGKTANDGSADERNGLFTSALLKFIDTPGLDIKDVFDRVGREVSRKTNGLQNPWISSKYYENYYLVPGVYTELSQEIQKSNNKIAIEIAPEYSSYDDFEFEITDINTIKITKYIGKDEAFSIPPYIYGKPVTIIGKRFIAFNDIVKYVTIPETVQTLNEHAISSSNLEGIIVNSANENFCVIDNVLYNKEVSSLIKYPQRKIGSHFEVPNSVSIIMRGAFSSSGVQSIQLPEGLVRIEEYSFEHCNSLEYINIPSSVTSIQYSVFTNISRPSLRIIDVHPDNQYYTSQNGVLYNKSVTALIAYANGNPREVFNIPETVTKIYEDAFFENILLKHVLIPSSVTEIGVHAFLRCKNLESVICFAATAPVVDEKYDPFGQFGKNVKLYRPKQSVESYATWEKDFIETLDLSDAPIN